jgi:hypothetical protein
VDIGDESNYKSEKEDESKNKPQWLEMGHLESNMLDRNFEKILTRSQSFLVNSAVMAHIMMMDEPHYYVEESRKK